MLIALVAALALSAAQDPKPEEIPRACNANLTAQFSWRACYAASDEGSLIRVLAALNVASEAYLERDYAEAVRLFDEVDVILDGEDLWPDPWLDAFRADAYQHVGRDKDALERAASSWTALRDEAAAGAALAESGLEPLSDEDTGNVLTLILPVLKKGGHPAFAPALAAFRALPVTGWADQARRAGVLEQLGDFDGALAASNEALKAQPGDPGLENNHCYILTRAGRPAEALPFCERAVAGLPEAAYARHSLAATLAGLGRCEDSAAELAEAARLDPSSALYRQPIACTPAP